MNILLVEPDRILARVATTGLETAGHQVVYARSAQTALDMLDEQLPDLIILEIQLGLHNGIEFLYELRSYPEWQNIPVVLHTLNSSLLRPQFAPALKELGVSHVLYKPHTPTSLLVATVNNLVVI